MQSRLTTSLFNFVTWALWPVLAGAIITGECSAQNKVIATFTFPEVRIKDFQNTIFPSSVANDRKVLLGSIGSDLWRGPNDAAGEFWMLTDRGPNGQIKVDGSNRRTFWIPEFNPAILKVKTDGNAIRILETIPIVGQSGKPVTGLPNFKNIDETPYDYSAQKELSFNVNGLDPEGLVRTSKGSSGFQRNTARRCCI